MQAPILRYYVKEWKSTKVSFSRQSSVVGLQPTSTSTMARLNVCIYLRDFADD